MLSLETATIMDIETLKAHVSMLKGKLQSLLRDLIDLSKYPGLFVSEYFYIQRNSIDIETEQKLLKVDCEKSELINKIREWMIESLTKHENQLLEAYKQGERAPRSFPLIEQAIESKFDSDISKHKCHDESSMIALYNDEYNAILAQIMGEIDKLKSEFLNNQTFFFYPTTERNGFGVLVHLEDVYFDEYESQCIV